MNIEVKRRLRRFGSDRNGIRNLMRSKFLLKDAVKGASILDFIIINFPFSYLDKDWTVYYTLFRNKVMRRGTFLKKF